MEACKFEEKMEILTEDVRVTRISNQKTGILSEEFLEPYKTKTPPFGPLGFVTYKRTYARKIEKENRTEEWWETCQREIEGIFELGCQFSREEAEQFYDDTFNLRCSFSGRAKWQLGTRTMEIGASSLCNCWGVVVDHPNAFVFALDMLMLGGGLGFSCQREHIYQLPKIKRGVKIVRQDTKDADVIVSDKRGGWTDLLSRVVDAWFNTGKSFTYSTICIRGKGLPIKRFGGTSSGPEPLAMGIEDINSIFRSRQGKKLRPIDCLDIMNIIGRIVVSGNVRRSALLSLGDHDDAQYLNAKRWDLGNIPNWRQYSNNSIVCNDINILPDSFWDSFMLDPNTGMAKGECYGLINLTLSRERGRVLDDHRKDPDVKVFNPCAEIGLAPDDNAQGQGESCNLYEIFLPRIKTLEEFIRVAKFGYRVTKTIAAQPYHWPETQRIVNKNMRLGISVTGIAQWLPGIGEEEAQRWLDTCYKELEKEDFRYSDKNKYPLSIKLTTTKPSGTLSILPHVTPGVHPAYSSYYIRRIRFSSEDPLVPELRERGYSIEPQKQFDGSLDHNTLVISFPVKAPEGAICAEDLSAIQQMELVKFMNKHWSDNSTSVTVYYKPEELAEIRTWLKENYNNYIKSISFSMLNRHGFIQAPYETISKEQYEEMFSKVVPIVSLSMNDTGFEFDRTQSECAGGACPVI